MTILIAGFAEMPVGINAMYATTRSGKRVLTEEARNYKEAIQYFFAGSEDPTDPRPYTLIFRDENELRNLTTNAYRYSIERNKKKALKYRQAIKIEYSLILKDDRRDIDGTHKLFQDALSAYLGVNDRWVTSVEINRILDASATPGIEFIVSVEDHQRKPGDLLSTLRQRLLTRSAS